MGIFGTTFDSERDIFSFLGLGDLERLRSVCTRFKQEIDERVWHAVADRLEIPQDNALEPRKRVYRFLIDLRKSVRDLPQKQVPEEINSIVAKGSDVPTIEQIKLLQEFRKARDICVVFKKLAKAINVQIPAIEWSNLKNILQTAKDFPSWINANQAALSNLKKLDLSRSQLTALPPLEKLTSLQWLDASHNQLTTLPALGNLTSLEHLDLSHNQLTALPPLGNLTSLEHLDLSNNQLITLPELGNLIALRVLYVSHNQLTTLPELENLASLVCLCLSYNRLTTLPPLEKLTSLQWLDASHNPLTAPPKLGNLTLEYLDTSHNQFTIWHLGTIVNLRIALIPQISGLNLTTQEVRYVLLPLIALGGICLGDYLTAGAQHIANAFFS